MDFYPFCFDSVLCQECNGQRFIGAGLILPQDLEAELPFKQYPKLRVDAEIAGITTEGAFMPLGGRRCIMVSKKLMKRAGVAIGDTITMRFSVADQDALRIPPILSTILVDDQELADLWETLPIGKRRGWCVRISKAKARETKLRQIEKLIAQLYDA